MRMKKGKIGILVVVGSMIALGAAFIGSGLQKRTDAVLLSATASADGRQLTLYMGVPTSMGYLRDFTEQRDAEGQRRLTFYSAFGGPNSSLGAKEAFPLLLEDSDRAIYLDRGAAGWELVLEKDMETGVWTKP